jgi:nucleotide-binding universal stress UspA family protein
MAKQRESNPTRSLSDVTGAAMPFRRMLVLIDHSRSADAAVALVAEWVDGPGAEVRFVQVSEERTQRHRGRGSAADPVAAEPHRLVVAGPTLGARNRQLVHGIAEAAQSFGADLIVLGVDRSRLAGHRLAPSLREQIMRATDLPVLVAPTPPSDGKRHHRLVPDFHRDEERVDAPGYARV